MRTCKARLISLMFVAVGVSALSVVDSEAQIPYGDQILVSDAQAAWNPSAAMDDGGNFVVAWQASYPGTSTKMVYARRFRFDGLPLGEAFQVSIMSGELPRVAMAKNGRFVIVWKSNSGALVRARPYLSDGTPVTDPFEVSDLNIGLIEKPVDVDIADNGVFVVVWDTSVSPDPTADMLDILARRFAADGTPAGDLYQVNSHTAGIQKHPRVAINDEGRKSVVVWESEGSPGDDQSLTSVVARIFDNDVPVVSDFQVNQTTSGNQRDPSVDMNQDPDNRIVFGWESEVSGGWYGIFGRRYLIDGSDTENELRLDEWPYGHFLIQEDPAIAVTSYRDVLVAWESHVTYSGDDPDRCVEARYRYADATWSPEFQVNNLTTGYQQDPDIALNERSDHVVVWWDADGVWARRYHPPGTIFIDGFEDGDTSGWD